MSECENAKPRSGAKVVQFRLLTGFAIVTWIAVATFTLWNMDTIMAIALNVVFAFALNGTIRSVSTRYTARERIYFAVKGGVALAAIGLGLSVLADPRYWSYAFQPMLNRATRERMPAIAQQLAQDERYANIKLSLGQFKGAQHIELNGTVSDPDAMKTLKQILADDVEARRLWWSVEIENQP